MPLQIRRGLEAERTQITPTNGLVEGELLYVTDEKKLYIGSGSVGEHQGVVITGYNDLDAKDAAAAIFADGEHTGITFTYDSGTKALNAVVDVSAISGSLVADALQGSVFADDSTLLVDAIDKRFFGNLTGNVLGNLAGNVIGNVIGNITGSVFSTDESIGLIVDTNNGVFNGTLSGGVISLSDDTVLVDATTNTFTGNLNGNVTGDVLGNLTGNVVGDVIGSIFADDSSIIVDAVNNIINIDNIITSDTLIVNKTSLNSSTKIRVQSNNQRSSLRLVRQSNSDISGSILDYGSILFERDDSVGLQTTATIIGGSDRLLFGVDSSGIFSESSFVSIGENGAVGIGTFTPAEALDVRGNAVISGFTQTGSFTDTTRNLLSPVVGMIIYNTTTNKFQGYQNTGGVTLEWVDLS
jgi:uncharacterized protein YcfJ